MTKETKAGTTFETTFDTLTKTPLCAPKTSSVEEITTEAKNGLKSPEMGLKLSDSTESFKEGENYEFSFSSSLFDDKSIVAKTFDKVFPKNSDSVSRSLARFSGQRNGESLFYPVYAADTCRWYVFDMKATLVCVITRSPSMWGDGKDKYVVSFTYSYSLFALLNKFVTRLKSYVLANHLANDDDDDDDDALFIENRFHDCSVSFSPCDSFEGF